jgi:hypothetical protein
LLCSSRSCLSYANSRGLWGLRCLQAMKKPAVERPRLIVEFAVENKAKLKITERRIERAARKSAASATPTDEQPAASPTVRLCTLSTVHRGMSVCVCLYAQAEDASEGRTKLAVTGFGQINSETKKRAWIKDVQLKPGTDRLSKKAAASKAKAAQKIKSAKKKAKRNAK